MADQGSSYSDAERDLADRAVAAGVEDMTPRKVKRWRGVGIIGESDERTYPGRAAGGGSRSVYGPPAVQRIVTADPIVKATSTLNEAVLVLFWRGHPVEPWGVKAAYRHGLRDLLRALSEHTFRQIGSKTSRAVADFVGARGRRTAHRDLPLRDWRERLPGTRRQRGAALERLLQGFTLTVLADEDAPDEPTPELVEASAMGEAMSERLGEIGPIDPTFPDVHVRALFRAFAFPSLRGVIGEAPFAELERARDDVKLVLAFSEVFADVVRRTTRIRWAFGFGLIADGVRAVDEALLPFVLVPGLLLARRMFPGPEIDETLHYLRSQVPLYQAHRRLLDALAESVPDVMTKVQGFGPAGFLGLTAREHTRIRTALRGWLDSNQEDAQLILEPP